jgi:hypothetical protein
MTRTPVPPTATLTRTATPTNAITPASTPSVLSFVSSYVMTTFPNPSTVNNGMRVRFEINRSADKAEFYLFTASRRKIRVIEIPRVMVVNNLTQGINDLVIGPQDISDLSAGIYYYYIIVDNAGQRIRSSIGKIVILK